MSKRANPWYEANEPPVLADWSGNEVSFDVTADIQEYLGADRFGRDPAWAIRAPEGAAPVYLMTREARRPPELLLELALPSEEEDVLGPLALDIDETIAPRVTEMPPLSEGGAA
jgi:hypothetical protein